MKATGPTSLATRKTVAALERQARKSKKAFWLRLAREAGKPRRRRVEVSLGKLGLLAGRNAGKILVVPGKVLGNGALGNAVEVVALEFSESARKKIAERGGKCIRLSEFVSSAQKPEKAVIVK